MYIFGIALLQAIANHLEDFERTRPHSVFLEEQQLQAEQASSQGHPPVGQGNPMLNRKSRMHAMRVQQMLA